MSIPRKLALLATISFSAWVANYTAAAHLTAFPEIAADFKVSIAAVANSIGLGILGLGTGALLWSPISSSLGRRTSYLLAWTLFVPCTFWLAFAKSYNSFAAARFFAGFCGSVSQTVPASIITDVFTPERRGTAIATWTLLLVIGPVMAPLVGAALLTVTDWRWIYRFVIILVGVTWIAIFLLVPETNYVAAEGTQTPKSAASVEAAEDRKEKLEGDEVTRTQTALLADQIERTQIGGHVGASWYPWREPSRFVFELLEPIKMAQYATVLIPSILYSVIFCWSVGFTVVLPQVLPRPPYQFTGVAVGCAFLAGMVGSILGKFSGGIVADRTVSFLQKRNQSARVPEYRLWAMLPQFLIIPLGLLLFGIGFDKHLDWPTPIISGVSLYYFANSALGGMLQTYICETYLEKAVHSIALFNFVKCILAFAAPFFIPEWAFEGFTKAYVIQAVVTTALGLAVIFGFILFGARIRATQRMPM